MVGCAKLDPAYDVRRIVVRRIVGSSRDK